MRNGLAPNQRFGNVRIEDVIGEKWEQGRATPNPQAAARVLLGSHSVDFSWGRAINAGLSG